MIVVVVSGLVGEVAAALVKAEERVVEVEEAVEEAVMVAAGMAEEVAAMAAVLAVRVEA